MILFREGASSGLRSLQAILHERQEAIRAAVAKSIAKRKESGAPMDDGDGPIEMPDPYELDPDLEGVRISVKQVTTDQHAAARLGWFEAIKDAEGAAARDKAGRKVMRDFVALALDDLDGLYFDEDKTERVTAGDLATLEVNGLLTPIFQACLRWQELSALEKKHCGSSLPSTSPNTTVTSAIPDFASIAVATATGIATMGGPTNGAPTTRAQSDTSGKTLGPGTSFGPSTPPTAS